MQADDTYDVEHDWAVVDEKGDIRRMDHDGEGDASRGFDKEASQLAHSAWSPSGIHPNGS